MRSTSGRTQSHNSSSPAPTSVKVKPTLDAPTASASSPGAIMPTGSMPMAVLSSPSARTRTSSDATVMTNVDCKEPNTPMPTAAPSSSTSDKGYQRDCVNGASNSMAV